MKRKLIAIMLTLCASIAQGQTTTLPAGAGQLIPVGQPSLALNHVIDAFGQLPAVNSSGMTRGMVYWVGAYSLTNQYGNPNANGATYASLMSSYSLLFEVIGTTYGTGGANTYNVPDLRGRPSFAAGNFDWGGAAVLGSVQGNANPVMANDQLPSHLHQVNSVGVENPTQTTGQSNPNPFSILSPTLAIRYLINDVGNIPSPTIQTDPPFIGQIQAYAGTQIPGGWLLAEGQLLQIAEHNSLYQVIGTTYGGDGLTTFALPDLRGRVPVGIGFGPGVQVNITLGQKFGAPDVVFSEANLPSHAHGLPNGDFTNPTGQAQALNWFQPSLGIQFLIALNGRFPTSEFTPFPEDLAIMGNIYGFAGDFTPQGFATCNGQFLPISPNQTLFALLGTNYGGNGTTNFSMPDLRGRTPIGSNPSANLIAGTTAGSSSHALSVGQMSSHVHGITIIDPLFTNSFE